VRPAKQKSRGCPGALVRRRSVPLSDVALLGPRRVPVTSLARTAVDLLEVLPFLALVVAMDSILRRRDVTAAEICAVARAAAAVVPAGLRSWPPPTRIRSSALESMLRVALAMLRPASVDPVLGPRRRAGVIALCRPSPGPVQRVIVEGPMASAYHRSGLTTSRRPEPRARSTGPRRPVTSLLRYGCGST